MEEKSTTATEMNQPTATSPVSVEAARPLTPIMRTALTLGVLLLVAVMLVAIYTLNAAKQFVDGIAGAFKPETSTKMILSGAIGTLSNKTKLVVLTVDVTASVTMENTVKSFGISIASAKVEVNAPAKIQYFVPLKNVKTEDFFFDPAAQRLIVLISKPRVDDELVSIETNPAAIKVKTEYGWSPLSLFEGAILKDEAMMNLKSAAIHQGRHELLQDRAEKDAKTAVQDLLKPLAEKLREGVKLEVEYKK